MRNRFNIFAAEEFDDSVVDGQGQVSETPVADQIESENSAVEINNEISTFEEHCDEVCNATKVADELQEQVDAQEEILEEKPEEVTEDTVAVAQEQFYITMSKIGSLQHYKTSGTISHEISAGTPAEKLKLTCEGVKDFIKSVWEKIKAAFRTIKNWFVKLLQKLGIMSKATNQTIKSELKKIEETPNVTPEQIDVAVTELTAAESSNDDNKTAVPKTLRDIIGWWGEAAGDSHKNLIEFMFTKKGVIEINKTIAEPFMDVLSVAQELLKDLMAKGEKFTNSDLDKRLEEIKKSFLKSNKNLIKAKSKTFLTNMYTAVTKITSLEISGVILADDALKGGSLTFKNDVINFNDHGTPISKQELNKLISEVQTNAKKLQVAADAATAEYNKVMAGSNTEIDKIINSYDKKLDEYVSYINKTNTELSEDLQTKNAANAARSLSGIIQQAMKGYVATGAAYLSASRRLITYIGAIKAKAAKVAADNANKK